MSEETNEQTQQQQEGATERVKAFADRFVSAQVDQLESMYEQAEKLQDQSIEQSKQHLEEAVELGEETLDYLQRLGKEWRDTQIETLRNLTD